MPRFAPVEQLFKGGTLRPGDRRVVRPLVSEFQGEHRDLVMMIERGIRLAHTAILETYINVKGAWAYLYQAVDRAGKDCRILSEPEPRCKRSQSASSKGNEGAANAHEDRLECIFRHRAVADLNDNGELQQRV
jgi:hypothetical protein